MHIYIVTILIIGGIVRIADIYQISISKIHNTCDNLEPCSNWSRIIKTLVFLHTSYMKYEWHCSSINMIHRDGVISSILCQYCVNNDDIVNIDINSDFGHVWLKISNHPESKNYNKEFHCFKRFEKKTLYSFWDPMKLFTKSIGTTQFFNLPESLNKLTNFTEVF